MVINPYIVLFAYAYTHPGHYTIDILSVLLVYICIDALHCTLAAVFIQKVSAPQV